METIKSLRAEFEALPPEVQAKVRNALSTEWGRALLLEGLQRVAPDLRRLERMERFNQEIGERERELEPTIADSAARRRKATEEVTKAFAVEYPEYELLEFAFDLQPPEAAELTVRNLIRAVEARPAASAKGRMVREGIERDIIHGDRHRILPSAESRKLWRTVRSALGKQKVKDIVKNVPSEATIDEVLRRKARDAAALVGGTENYKRFSTSLRKLSTQIAKAAEGLAADPPAPELIDRFRAHREAADGDAKVAYKELVREFSADEQKSKYLSQLNPVARVLGPEDFGRVADLVFRPGGVAGEG